MVRQGAGAVRRQTGGRAGRVEHLRKHMRSGMRHVITRAIAGLGLAGCGPWMNPRPPMMQIDLQSTPPGANAVTSIGPACTTPCAVTVSVPTNDFSVNFTLADFQPMTVSVRVSGA